MIWVLALFAFMLPINAGAADPSHFSLAIGINCSTCHQQHRTFGVTKSGEGGVPAGTPIIRNSPATYNNICQQCHRTGDGFAHAKPMALVDTSNIFGNHSTENFGNLRQTSHRWDGSDTNPAAGAQPPILAAMTTNTNGTLNLRGRSGNELACVRCHSPHLTDAPGKMLRAPIDQNQMCLDCHRSRDKQSHLSGTHPVRVNYDTAAAKGNFNSPPLNANPTNPTSDLANYLTTTTPARHVVCTTCHGVHYTDSRSSTFDGASTAKGKGNYTNLSTGDGYQLRTDRRGAKVTAGTPDKLNICTNCHANKKSHNAASQDVQCLDCHAAHVEYDPKDPTNTKGTNIYLVKRNVSHGGSPASIYFTYTSKLKKEYKNSSGTGVCQGCHNVPPPGGKYPAEHDLTLASDCNKCHFHSSDAGSFSGSCGQCHSASGGLVTTGSTTNATGGVAGAHGQHVNGALKMECNTCHSGYTYGDKLINMNFQLNGVNVPGFTNVINTGSYNNTNAQLINGYTWSGAGVLTNGSRTAQTCDNIYCHGATLTGGSKSNPSWTNGSAEVACGTCHGATAAAPPTSGSHARHAGAAAGQLQVACQNCHGVVADNKHVNGNVKWNLSALGGGQYKTPSGKFYTMSGSTGRLAPSSSYGSCSTVYCHSNGGPNGTAMVYTTVTWGGAALTCGSCHANMATSAATNGGHFKHSSTVNAGGPAFDCSICHSGYTASTTNGATHANKFVDLISAITGYSKASPMAASGAWGTCSASQCHGQATGLTWNNGSIWQTGGDRCSTCHSSTSGVTVGTPFYSTGFPTKQTLNTDAKVGAHTLHLTSANIMSVALNCAECHGPVALKDTNHMNGSTNFMWGTTATHSGVLTPNYDSATGTCSNVYCHGARMPYLDATGTNRAPSWKTPFMPATLTPESCKSCHGFPPSPASNHPVIATPTSFPTPLCTPCHPNVNAAGTTYANIFINKAEHIDGISQTNGGSCDACHGYPPSRKSFVGSTGNWVNAKIENYTGGGGAHTIAGHVNPNAVIADAFTNCTPCHKESDHNMGGTLQPSGIKLSIDPKVRFSENRAIKYTSNNLDGAAHVSGNCSNISCHFQKTPKW